MSTGARFVDFTEKRLIGNSDLDERLLSYLQTLVQESLERSFSSGIVYDTALSLSASGADAFDVGGTSLATDGLGRLLDIAASGFASGITFENTAAIVYDVALHFATVPDGVQINPLKGLPEYISEEEVIGESADPSTVVDNGSTITFGVDSVAEASVSHAGRTVRVFKKAPLGKNATTAGVAIEDVTVVFTGSVNQITTTGVLGQDTVSTTASDYTVVLLGPTVRRNTALLGALSYAFLGTVTGIGAGGTPTTFDTTDQSVAIASLANLNEITSLKTTNRLRVDVKSVAGDVSEDQIVVRNPSGTPVFQVDGNGNVTIAGTTTQEDVVQVNSSETITDNLTAGDNDAVDSHLIKGTWRHTNTAGSANHFAIDGATGRIGIGQAADGSHALAVTGDVDVNGALSVIGFSVAGDFIPVNNGTQDIGSPSFRWDRVLAGTLDLNKTSTTLGTGLAAIFSSSLASATRGFDIRMTATDPTGDPTGGFLVVASGHTTGTMAAVTGLDINTQNISATQGVTNLYGIRVRDVTTGGGVIATQYGLKVESLTSASTNFAIFTNSGIVQFGDLVQPDTDNTRALGTISLRWSEVHADEISAGPFIGSSTKLLSHNTDPAVVAAGIFVARPTGSFSAAASGLQAEYQANFSSGSISDARAFRCDVRTPNTTGVTATNIVGILCSTFVDAGGDASSTTNLIGIKINGGTVTTEVVNSFGLQIANIEQGATSNFAIQTGTGIVSFGDAVAMGVLAGDPSTIANFAHIYTKDVTASAEVFVRDEAGNVTQISPHDPETGEWVYDSRNDKTGKHIRVSMEQLVREVEKLSGKKLLHELT